MLPLTPTKLGRYEIVDEIGKGAMGVVYLARDPLIGRLVALKTFRIGYSVKDQELEQFRIRFLREAQSAGILTHPNIVTIHDVVEQSEEGLAFIAMEYVRGTNLKQILQGDQPLTLQFIVDVVAQVGEALDYAHSNRVIHRDVKPANILITGDNRVKITDFGIARIDTSNLTQEGQLLGTPNYMAPEQIQGREVDWRADLFSLGVVLYEMLTRHKPFQGENLTVVSHRIVYDPFTPPRDYIRDLPPGVEKILTRALEKDAARRYQRARDMMEDLRRLLAERSVRDDLNETQSLAQTVVLPSSPVPPPPPSPVADLGTGTGVATGTGGTYATGGASPVPAGSVPRPRQRTVRRLLAVGGSALALSILFWAGMLLWIAWTQPSPVEVDPVADQARGRYVELMRQGHKAARAGDFTAAALLYGQAERVAPEDEKAQARHMREETEKLASGMPQMIEQQKEIAAKIEEAKKALAVERYGAALAAVQAVLLADPQNPEAQEILAEVEKGLTRTGDGVPPMFPGGARPGGGTVAGTTVAPGTVPEAPGQPREGAVAEKPMLHVDLDSQFFAGSVIVRLDRQEVRRIPFDFSSGGGFLRGRRKGSGTLQQAIPMPPGYHRLSIQVSPRNKPAEVEDFDVNFENGPKTVHIQISESGQATISLR
ncbi:MAG TPA: serine/threonine-protein kinase [Thermoanaerobaculia bacterium]|nr:serine/threonine-protein kinase [Thermoanaerobaculia bacterium]